MSEHSYYKESFERVGLGGYLTMTNDPKSTKAFAEKYVLPDAIE